MTESSPAGQWLPPRASLFFLGFLTLFLELVMIRFLAGSIWNLGYFPNLVLFSVFVGMGAGFLNHGRLGERGSRLTFGAAPFALLGLVAFVVVARPRVPGFEAWSGNVGGELYFSATQGSGDPSALYFLVWFALLALLFAAVSQRTARLFSALEPLDAYTLDIGGSCAGIVLFMTMSWFHLPAHVWFFCATVLFLLASPRAGSARQLAALLLPLLVAYGFVQHDDSIFAAAPRYAGPHECVWSPYQRLDVVRGGADHAAIFANGLHHQSMLRAERIPHSLYQAPYRSRAARQLPPYRRVLIIGAGSGNDVAAALHNGATHVDAVDIDPVIQDIGARIHPARPYADPRVRRIVADGREWLTRAPAGYDLIIYALTDSVVKISSTSQLRLENYLFTEESVRRAVSRLSPTGDVLFYNFYRRDWLIERLLATLARGSGRQPAVVHRASDFVIMRVGRSDPPLTAAAAARLPVSATDDWPFPYLRERGIPGLYLRALGLGLLLVLGLLAALRHRERASGEEAPHGVALRLAFALMGAAFLLLETKSVVQFSLLFGTTWLNSSLVFLGVLVSVLLANRVAARTRDPRLLPAASALLFVGCVATLLFPLANLLRVESGAARFVLAALLTFSPIFFANLIFSVALRDARRAELLFGWNLVGATLGGLLEYTSMAIGYNALALIVAACYLAVVLALRVAKTTDAPPASP